MRLRHLVVPLVALLARPVFAAEPPLRAEAAAGLKKAVTFFREHVAVEGGYVYRVSADLKLREGEGVVPATTIWVQPPGTPAVGMAMLEAWERTKEPYLLEGATDAGRSLVRGQLHSGGWQDRIDFGEDRKRLAYRVDGKPAKKARNISSFDDDKTQSALRLMIRLDQAHAFKDAEIHESALAALTAVLGAQHANGAWSQVWDGPSKRDDDPVLKASFPAEWSRKYPGGDYWWHYTFNDNAMGDTVDALLLAHDVYRDAKYLESAKRCGDFILRAQLPGPQPGWAQQYDREMHPAWARKFEPPAVTGGESQGVMRSLLKLYAESGDKKYLEPIPRAVAYYRKSVLPDGRLARFYEMKTNRPLYFTKKYELTYKDDDMPTHYAFKVGQKLDQIEKEYERLGKLAPEELKKKNPAKAPKVTTALVAQVESVLKSMDADGRWIIDGKLRYQGPDDTTDRIIDVATFNRNVAILSKYLAAAKR